MGRAVGAWQTFFRAELTCAALFAVTAAACSSHAGAGSASPDPPHGDAGVTGDSAVVGCENDPRADRYSSNLTKTGRAGVFRFVLVNATPAPPALRDNTFVLKVLDPSGNPVQGVSITSVTPFMPDHGHGTSVTPTVTANSDGTFTIAPLFLFMAGLWQITVTGKAGAQQDQAVFSFCIAG